MISLTRVSIAAAGLSMRIGECWIGMCWCDIAHGVGSCTVRTGWERQDSLVD